MIRAAANSKSGVLRKVKRVWRDDDASQIVEFALSLPLLVVFVVGIFDFSSAITLKQKLTNAAREGARVAASDPANDLGGSVSSVPVSVADALWVVDNYLTSEKIADCQLTTGGKPLQTGSTLTWVSTGTGSPCTSTSGLILTVNRGWITQETVAGTTVNVVATQVTIQYPYAWQFSGVFGLTGKRFVGPTTITTSATALNEN